MRKMFKNMSPDEQYEICMKQNHKNTWRGELIIIFPYVVMIIIQIIGFIASDTELAGLPIKDFADMIVFLFMIPFNLFFMLFNWAIVVNVIIYACRKIIWEVLWFIFIPSEKVYFPRVSKLDEYDSMRIQARSASQQKIMSAMGTDRYWQTRAEANAQLNDQLTQINQLETQEKILKEIQKNK